jgi:hypothetical protein
VVPVLFFSYPSPNGWMLYKKTMFRPKNLEKRIRAGRVLRAAIFSCAGGKSSKKH